VRIVDVVPDAYRYGYRLGDEESAPLRPVDDPSGRRE
jgi:hypothetical protein